MKRLLCVPCAVKVAATKEVTKIGNRKDKITCTECGRRRYGAEYEVKRKTARNEKNDTKSYGGTVS